MTTQTRCQCSQRLRRHATIGLYQIEFLITFNISFYIFQKQNNLPGVRCHLLNEVNDYADTVGVVNKNKKVPKPFLPGHMGPR